MTALIYRWICYVESSPRDVSMDETRAFRSPRVADVPCARLGEKEQIPAKAPAAEAATARCESARLSISIFSDETWFCQICLRLYNQIYSMCWGNLKGKQADLVRTSSAAALCASGTLCTFRTKVLVRKR